MARTLRGDFFWTELDPTKGNEQAGRRSVLVLSPLPGIAPNSGVQRSARVGVRRDSSATSLAR
jgi:mRNA-degrading endonuclease toxin of MazEF toxin-antitoxin module